jgi:hypothetical protein
MQDRQPVQLKLAAKPREEFIAMPLLLEKPLLFRFRASSLSLFKERPSLLISLSYCTGQSSYKVGNCLLHDG